MGSSIGPLAARSLDLDFVESLWEISKALQVGRLRDPLEVVVSASQLDVELAYQNNLDETEATKLSLDQSHVTLRLDDKVVIIGFIANAAQGVAFEVGHKLDSDQVNIVLE